MVAKTEARRLVGWKLIHDENSRFLRVTMATINFDGAILSHLSRRRVETMIEEETTSRNEHTTDSILPKQNSEYNSLDYWEQRFAKEETYEWLLSYDQLASKLSKYLTKTCRILVVGCGNAPFSTDLYDADYRNLVNIDYSTSVIALMQKKRPDMEWLVMDMTNLTFEDASFDVVIDKAAFDAMLADEGDVWSPNQASIDLAHDACRSIARVLKPNAGVFLQVSLVQPHFRKKYLLGWHKKKNGESDESYAEDFGWTLEVQSAADDAETSFGHFLYIMTIGKSKTSKNE